MASFTGNSLSEHEPHAAALRGETPPWRWMLGLSTAASVAGLGLLIQTRAADLGTAGRVLAPPDGARTETRAPPFPSDGVSRMREGIHLDGRAGQFRPGDRWIFVPFDGRERFTVLENLNLERIAKLMAERPDVTAWRVSGRVTEYRGANYLLIEHAVMTGTAPDAPSQAMRH